MCIVLCLPSDDVLRELQRRSLINIPRKKESILKGKSKKETYV